MKRHEVKQFGATLALVAALAVAPPLFWRMQSLPPLHLPTAQKVCEALDAEIERKHGPMMEERYEREWREAFTRGGAIFSDHRFREIGEEKCGEAERFDPVADLAVAEYAPDLERWDRLAREGLWEESNAAWFARVLAGRADSGRVKPRPFDSNGIIRIELALARTAARRGDWDSALQRLAQAAHAGDCFRMSDSHYGRATVYAAFQSVLAFDPPESFERAALTELIEMANTDPVRDELLYRQWVLRECESPISSILAGEGGHMQIHVATELDSTASLADSNPDLFAHPELAAMARRLADRQRPYPMTGRDTPPLIAYQPEPGHGFRWTGSPAAKRWFMRAVEKEPALWAGALPSRESLGTLDRWTWGLLNRPAWLIGRDRSYYAEQIEFLGAADATRAAYAARLWRREHGDWPTNAKALADAYLPGFDKPATRIAGLPPRAPVDGMRLGWIDTNASVRETLWKRMLPAEYWLKPYPYSFPAEIDEVYRASPEWTARRAVSVVQAMRHHPKLVERVELRMLDKDGGRWLPLDEATEQQLGSDPNLVATRWRLTAKLRAPEKVFAIRLPGVDGKDHGGALAFNPLRDGLAGEIMVFPEGF